MARSGKDATESGVMVYPRLPVPEAREREGERRPPKGPRGTHKLLIAGLGVAFVGGIVIGAVLRPVVAPDARIAAAEDAAATAGSAAAASKARADGLEQELAALTTKKQDVEKKLAVAAKAETQLADTAAAAGKQAEATAALQKQLAAALKGAATVTADGADVRISIGSGVLFAKDDVLSPGGKQVIERAGAALKDLPDKYAWVQGHTDDTPPPLPPAPKPAPPPKRGAKPAPPPPAPVARFTTNWELSAARAVAVVRHLQEASKLDPVRLSAAGFGQYRPVSRRDKAQNRRIEIVVYPRPAAN